MTSDRDQIRKAITEHYGRLAELATARPHGLSEPTDTIPLLSIAPESSCGDDCCGPSDLSAAERSLIKGLYAQDEVAGLPEGALVAAAGCGNPTAIAEIRPGETVLDLGSGGGIDCFLAARQTGPAGRVIGIDMTQKMIDLARRNAAELGVTNVDFLSE